MNKKLCYGLMMFLPLGMVASCSSPAATPTSLATVAGTGSAISTQAVPSPSAIIGSPTVSLQAATVTPMATSTIPPQATATVPKLAATATVVTPTPTIPARTATPLATTARGKRAFLGYYVPYDSSSWLSLEAQAENIDIVVAQWTTVDACGNIGSKDDRTLIAWAKARGIQVFPSLFTNSKWLNHRLLTEEAVTAKAIDELVDYVVEEGYTGLDVDLEDMASEDRPHFTRFIARLSTVLHQKGKLLAVALPAKTSDVTTGWAGPYDYGALAPYVDIAMIMTYAYTTAGGAPGSTAPYEWVDRVIAYVTSQIPAEKVIVGLGFWAYDWNVTTGGTARALRYSQAATIAGQYGESITLDPVSRSATFAYTANWNDPFYGQEKLPTISHDIRARNQPACAVPTPTSPPKPVETPAPTATAAPTQRHVVWLEDAASTAERLSIAQKYNTRGVGAWRLGQEDPAVWSLLSKWRTGR